MRSRANGRERDEQLYPPRPKYKGGAKVKKKLKWN
jgi:hypothetical protein